jgi:hypothetical protein
MNVNLLMLISKDLSMHKKGENWNRMADSKDLEIKRNQEGFERRRCPLCRGGGGMLNTYC